MTQADIEKEKKLTTGCGIGCAPLILLLIVIGLLLGSNQERAPTTDSSDKLRDSTQCQAIAMQETGELSGPNVDAAHERCMASRGYRKR